MSEERILDTESHEGAVGRYDARKLEALRIAAAEADKGVFISQEAVDAWVMSWGTDNELPRPEPDIFPKK
ncbi:hypothetical protein GCM10007874_65910 [Labrys miyagiensis]|uniref:CopG family transcriptional regulator n=1 Tax=Labrys miyagiensis TaxID=346912 RepID=A0ABQ6CTW0_9HYPH|nr:hypothetical protein [Labrys miyagiensis]GLS23570.1 hypothetical protein GCM10007874_65910 [Labrys miyagiensis]